MPHSKQPSSDSARGTLGTVRNAVLLLDLLSDGPAFQQLTDLAERSGLSVPTAHRLLRSLVLADIVKQDARSSRYSLGPEVARLSQRYLARLPILSALAPFLISLRDTLHTTIHVAVLTRESVVYVDRVDASDGGPYRESHRVANALVTPSGRLLVARGHDDHWQQCLETLVDPLPGEPEELRRRWATAEHLISENGLPGLFAEVAVAVTDSSGMAVAALAATMPTDADDAWRSHAAQQLALAAGAAGRTMGNA